MRGNETAGLEGIVAEDPSELDARIEEVRRGLESDDLATRRDAGRAFRVAAEENARLVEPHFETVVSLLADSSGSVRLSGAICLRELAEIAPGFVAERVPELLALLEDADAPAIQMAAIRALTRVGTHSPAAVAVADEIMEEVLRTATPPIRTAVLTVFAGVVVEDPATFPETVCAMEGALSDESARIRRTAAAALAAVATADPSAVSSVAGVRERVEELEARVIAQPWHADDTIENAADAFRSLDGSDRA